MNSKKFDLPRLPLVVMLSGRYKLFFEVFSLFDFSTSPAQRLALEDVLPDTDPIFQGNDLVSRSSNRRSEFFLRWKANFEEENCSSDISWKGVQQNEIWNVISGNEYLWWWRRRRSLIIFMLLILIGCKYKIVVLIAHFSAIALAILARKWPLFGDHFHHQEFRISHTCYGMKCSTLHEEFDSDIIMHEGRTERRKFPSPISEARILDHMVQKRGGDRLRVIVKEWV